MGLPYNYFDAILNVFSRIKWFQPGRLIMQMKMANGWNGRSCDETKITKKQEISLKKIIRAWMEVSVVICRKRES